MSYTTGFKFEGFTSELYEHVAAVRGQTKQEKREGYALRMRRKSRREARREERERPEEPEGPPGPPRAADRQTARPRPDGGYRKGERSNRGTSSSEGGKRHERT